jgi:hypothetical protein
MSDLEDWQRLQRLEQQVDGLSELVCLLIDDVEIRSAKDATELATYAEEEARMCAEQSPFKAELIRRVMELSNARPRRAREGGT